MFRIYDTGPAVEGLYQAFGTTTNSRIFGVVPSLPSVTLYLIYEG